MPFEFLRRRLTLRTRLISNYLVILAIGGLVTSLVGSWIVSSTIMMQARRSVDHDLVTARTLYDHQLERLRLTVRMAASGTTINQFLSAGDKQALVDYLASIRRDGGFDFLGLTDSRGLVTVRVTQPDHTQDDVSSIGVVAAALAGEVAAATEILPAEILAREDPRLSQRAYIRLIPTPRAKLVRRTEETSGMLLMAAAPMKDPRSGIIGVLYGGVLLNRNFAIVDRAWELVFKGEQFRGQNVGTVTIFQNDLRISTNVQTANGERALGTRVSAEVYDAVLGRGEAWKDRAFVVNDWYISGYEPIRNYRGDRIGILYVGLLEKAYTSIRDRVILSFFGIATLGFVLIIGITYYEIRNITRPVGELVAASRNIAAGRFDQEVRMDAQGEIALLADSFNAMVHSLRQMRADLEEWARTLEQKVKERTDALMDMQAKVTQAQRLASLGKLAAGVAHEINNPLGGILSLTALTLEDVSPDDPNRENLTEVLRQAERCRDIVRGLLEFSRQSEAHKELVDLNRVLQDTLSLLASQALFLNVTVVNQLDPQLPPVVADRSQFQQVLMNILMNAVQAMDEKGTITLTTRLSSREGHVEVLISDTGHGIPPDRLDRIFDPFFTTKASGKGTGLGLSIAYGIVTDHRGTISVESEVGKGSTFTVQIPAATTVVT